MNSVPRTTPQAPALAGLLQRLRARIVRGVVAHGVGTLLLALFGWLAFAFVADYFLHVPRWVRLLHLGAFIGLGAFVALRFLIRPLGQVPEPDGLAVLAERADTSLDALLVSAVEFQASPAEDELAATLEAQTIERANDAAKTLDTRGVLTPKEPRQRLLSGAAVALAVTLMLAVTPERARVFLGRFFGGNEPWPRRTTLALDVRLDEGEAEIQRDGDVLRIAVARGVDIPIAVTATGVIPTEVRLNFEGGAEQLLSPTAGGTFGTVLRAVGDDLAFWATGGDDNDNVPRVELSVLEPPAVTGVTISTVPPDYSGLPNETHIDQDVRALVGTRVRVAVAVTPAEARGQVRILPEDRVVELTSIAPDPIDVASGDGLASGAPISTLGFDFTLERDVRLRFELVDDRGLENPDPGLIAIDAIVDRAPELQLLAPGRSDVETVAGGALALRIGVTDDFGLAAARWRAREASANEWSIESELTLTPREPTGTQKFAALAANRIEVNELLGALEDASDPVGRQFELQASADDNAQPAQVGFTSPVRIRVLSADEFLRRIQDRLADARRATGELSELQREARQRGQELLASLTEEGGQDEVDARSLRAALNSERRVEGDAITLLRELTSVTELVLYARLDDSASGLLDTYDAAAAQRFERSFSSQPWREVLARNAVESSAEVGLAGHLLSIVELSLEIAEARIPEALERLDLALASGTADDLTGARAELALALEAEGAVLRGLEDLMERLAEWDNFQSVLSLTRDILNRQKALQERTVRYASK